MENYRLEIYFEKKNIKPLVGIKELSKISYIVKEKFYVNTDYNEKLFEKKIFK